jgi:hypothetical protein
MTYSKAIMIILMFGCLLGTFNQTYSKSFSSDYQYSPFGISAAFSRPFLTDNTTPRQVIKKFSETIKPYSHVQDIGARWIRLTSDIYWSKVQPTREYVDNSQYDWSFFDILIGRVPSGVNILGTISIGKERIQKSNWEFANKDIEKKYIEFVKKVVDRYDGDGINDMPGLKNPIKCWQIENEPALYYEPIFDWEGFSHLVEVTYKAIKDKDLKAEIALGGLAGGNAVNNVNDPFYPLFLKQLKDFYYPLLKSLSAKNIHVDIFDIHYYSGNLRWPSDKWEDNWKCMKDIYTIIRKNLDKNGYKNTQIWITETATMEKINGEKAQAASLVKRYIYPLSFGVKKIFWWNMVEGEYPLEVDKPANHFGLIYDGIGKDDPGYGVKKLSYYAYKKMVELFEGSDWNNIETIQEQDGIYIYKFMKRSKSIWAAWNENRKPRMIAITLGKGTKNVKITDSVPKYTFGKYITNYAKAFNIRTQLASKEGQIAIRLGEDPVFVEEE